ncbi:2-dehydro-3-deoxygalactonokinase [Pseudooceanicola sp.]|uniref:2-dehydro-3-deoxygalactonokinase n=1 Tax=Pseudooceanicola sp. TaxID=1914328 RepID=UPI0035C7365A
MDWCGQIIGDDRSWGSPGADRRLIVGDANTAAAPATGPLIPDPLPDAAAYHLPALGSIPAVDRLALIGFQALNPHWDGVAVVVGDAATNWATLSAREVIHQQASATPRIAQAMGLANARAAGLEAALDRPERLPLLLADAGSEGAQLGALLGAEIGATRTLWLGQQAVLIGEGPLARGYGAALQAAHVPVTLTERRGLLQKGFEALAAAFPEG